MEIGHQTNVVGRSANMVLRLIWLIGLGPQIHPAGSLDQCSFKTGVQRWSSDWYCWWDL